MPPPPGLFVIILSSSYILDTCLYSNERKKECGFGLVRSWGRTWEELWEGNHNHNISYEKYFQ